MLHLLASLLLLYHINLVFSGVFSDGVEESDKQTEDEGKVVWPGDIPESAIDARVTLDSILKVSHALFTIRELNNRIAS